MSSVADLASTVDDLYVILTTTLIFMQQAGFAMYECGNVRRANTKTILVKNFMDTCISVACFWLIGYTLAYGENSSLKGFSGGEGLVLQDANFGRFFVSWAYVATATSIVSGAVAERCQMKAYIVASVLMSSVIYPIISYWCWSSDGWLSMSNTNSPGGTTADVGVIDFAGSGVVHLTGGVAALVGAIMVGPRQGRFIFNSSDGGERQKIWQHVTGTVEFLVSKKKKETEVGSESPSHSHTDEEDLSDEELNLIYRCGNNILNIYLRCMNYISSVITSIFGEGPIVVPMQRYSPMFRGLGTFLLWFGWYGFNLSSLSGVASNGLSDYAALIAVNTTIGATFGSLTPTLVSSLTGGGGIDFNIALNGTLAGLVSVTAGCSVIEPWAAMVIGMIGGLISNHVSKIMLFFGIDDVVDAVAVHGGCGVWGVISTALFAKPFRVEKLYGITGSAGAGLFYGGDGQLLQMAIIQILCIIAFTSVISWMGWKLCELQHILRVDEKEERDGLDVTQHGNTNRKYGLNLFEPKTLLSSAVLLDKLENVKQIHKADLIGMCIDVGIEVTPLMEKFNALAGGSHVLSGHSLELFVHSLIVEKDRLPFEYLENVHNDNQI